MRCLSDNSQTSCAFVEKNWFADFSVNADGFPLTDGNKEVALEEGFSDYECRKKTSEQVDKIINAICALVAPEGDVEFTPEFYSFANLSCTPF
jgi:hypothetical protein